MSARSGVSPAPAAAMISGLNGLDELLAWLPFLECCIPCTIEVCLWCQRGPAVCARDGEWDCDGEIAVRPPACSFSREDSREWAT